MTKVCSVCGQLKDESEFYVIRPQGRPPRLQNKCKECSNAYHRARHIPKRMPIDPHATGKVCTNCNTFKPFTEFHFHRVCAYGYETICKQCKFEIRKERQQRDPEHTKSIYLKSLYGITYKDRQAMQQQQENKCAICQRDNVKLVVDHDHATGVVRGLLCNTCNRMIGMAHENCNTLANAIAYLYQAQHPEWYNVRAEISFTYDAADGVSQE